MSYTEIIGQMSVQEKALLASKLTLSVMVHAPKIEGEMADELALRISINRTLSVFADILEELGSGQLPGFIPEMKELLEQEILNKE